MSVAPAPIERAGLLGRYVQAFERFDLGTLASLLHLDETLSMPPYSQWLRGRDDIRAWYTGPGSAFRGSTPWVFGESHSRLDN